MSRTIVDSVGKPLRRLSVLLYQDFGTVGLDPMILEDAVLLGLALSILTSCVLYGSGPSATRALARLFAYRWYLGELCDNIFRQR